MTAKLLTRAAVGALLALLSIASPALGQDLFFQRPQKGNCSGDGLRQFAAIIDGRNFHGDWVQACRVTKAEINGERFSSRNCGWNGGRVWGQFDVPDESCAVSLFFLSERRGECQVDGRREFSAIMSGRNFTGDWVDACRRTSATILGVSVPSRDCEWIAGRVWGKFDVPDASCRTRVRGNVRYQDFSSDYRTPPAGQRSLATLGAPRPIRRSLVEIWYGSGAGRTKQVVNTADDGTFDTFVPTVDPSNYRVVLVASNQAGQANLKDNTAAWYWTPELTLTNHPDGDGLFLSATVSKPEEAMAFNAADVLLVGYDYALSHGIPASRIYRVSIVPQSSNALWPRTTASGAASLIWLPVDMSNMNFMFDDGAVLHEFAHHLQRMNDTYAAWAAVHNGCAANFGWSVNSAEYAWFEGFPEYFRVAAGRSNTVIVRNLQTWAGHAPAGAKRAPSGTPPCPESEIPPNGPASVEDYVASLLLDLVLETGIIDPAGTVPLSKDQLEKRLLELWFNDTRTVRTPGNGMPRVGDFQTIWNRAFPASGVLNALMTAYGM